MRNGGEGNPTDDVLPTQGHHLAAGTFVAGRRGITDIHNDPNGAKDDQRDQTAPDRGGHQEKAIVHRANHQHEGRDFQNDGPRHRSLRVMRRGKTSSLPGKLGLKIDVPHPDL